MSPQHRRQRSACSVIESSDRREGDHHLRSASLDGLNITPKASSIDSSSQMGFSEEPLNLNLFGKPSLERRATEHGEWEGRNFKEQQPSYETSSSLWSDVQSDLSTKLKTSREQTPGHSAFKARRHTDGEVGLFPTAERALSPIYRALSPQTTLSEVYQTPVSSQIVKDDEKRPLHHWKASGRPPVAHADRGAISEPIEAPSFGSFIEGELQPSPIYATTDALWGQTERDRVYNALIDVPYQFERLLWLGFTICLDSFLSVFALLPVRIGVALFTLIRTNVYERYYYGDRSSSQRLRGDQIYDLLCAAMFVCLVACLWSIRAGSIYFWVKDMTQEFLKLSVLHSALDLSDKICCSFAVDVLEALAASCTTLAADQKTMHGRWQAAANVLSDFVVSLFLLLAHGSVLMAQALVFGVAMNSQKNTFIALLIASNFTEIKGTVFKRFDPVKLFTLTRQDIVERFHMVVALTFVLAEEAAGRGAALPSKRMLLQCAYVMLAETVIDIIKHAVVGKFNEIRPGMYREFTKDLCEQLTASQSHTIHRLVLFEPFGPAALFFRVVMTFMVNWRSETGRGLASYSTSKWLILLNSSIRILISTCALAMLWFLTAVLTVSLGYVMKCGAAAFVRHYESRRGKYRGMQSKARAGTNTGGMAASTSAATESVLQNIDSDRKEK